MTYLYALLPLLGGVSPLFAGEPPAPFAPDSCPDVGLSLGDLRIALDEARFDEADDLGRRLEERLCCQSRPVNPITLTSLYQLLGAVQYFAGDASQAAYYWSVALAVAPASGLDPSLGAGAISTFEAIRTQVLESRSASIHLQTGVTAWLDGHPLREGTELDIAPGMHLLQRQEPGGGLTSQLIQAAPGIRYAVEKGDALIRMDGSTVSRVAQALVEPEKPPSTVTLPWGRLALDGAVTGAGLALGAAALYNYAQASKAYHDYLWTRDAEESAALYAEEIRPRGSILLVEGVGAAVLLGSGTALWLTTDGLAPEGDTRWKRLALGGTALAGGAGLGAASVYNLAQAGTAYDDYVAESMPARTEDIYALEIRPRRRLAMGEGLGALALLGAGAALVFTTDLSVSVQPGAVTATAIW